MATIDKRNVLLQNPFSYHLSKDGKVHISWKGKPVKVIRGSEAQKLISKITGIDEGGIQLELARITGNFKRGNERERSQTPEKPD